MKCAGGGTWLILTGPAGAGKFRCAQTLRGFGYAPLLGLPVSLLPRLEDRRDMVIVPRVESGQDVASFLACLPGLCASHRVETIYFQAAAEELVCRLKAERRCHPDQADGKTLLEACRAELFLLRPLAEAADRCIPCWPYDSSAQRRAYFTQMPASDSRMSVRICSFSFRHGPPLEADLVLDVRCLPNPYYDTALRSGTGLDRTVAEFVFATEPARRFLDKWLAFLEEAVCQYETEGKQELVIAVGCTGGRHRSVAVAVRLASFLSQRGYTCALRHLELSPRESKELR